MEILFLMKENIINEENAISHGFHRDYVKNTPRCSHFSHHCIRARNIYAIIMMIDDAKNKMKIASGW